MGVASSATPLLDSRRLLARFSGQQVLLGFSGGKDSLAVLELMIEAGVRPLPFAMHFLPGLRCFEENLRPAEVRYGLRVLRLPHWDLPRLYLDAVYRPHLPPEQAARLRKLTLNDVEARVRAQTGASWIFYGQRMTDSLERRAMLHRIAGVDDRAQRAYPIYTWADRHVKAFLRARKIRLPGLTVGRSSGVSLDPKTLVFLRDRYPDDLAKILEQFPYAEAALARHDAGARQQAPELHDGDDPA